MSLRRTTKTRRKSEIDMSPMMDMVFILLIFFVVTSTFTRETGMDVTKPKASAVVELSREAILVGLSRQGTIHVNEAQVSLSALRRVLENIVRETPDRPVILVADRETPGGLIVDVLDECNLAHVAKVSIAAQRD
jgi:biopolymer transport protein ExbD